MGVFGGLGLLLRLGALPILPESERDLLLSSRADEGWWQFNESPNGKYLLVMNGADRRTISARHPANLYYNYQWIELGNLRVLHSWQENTAENLWKGTPQHRWRLTFGFGLIHGFGFANVLREMGLPATGLMRSLLCFNLGVETGQIILLCILWPLIWWLNRQRWAPQARQVLSILILLLGSAWFCERAFGWRFMPF